ncbi:MAG: hypothetical protein JJU34_18505 [Lunatimonas sp.]|uniref:hypothetical protein n=1 Tax=Lunatimonas sp. TaxID=2060141 RepID=UPI00263B6E02|nr:hypothetical protein [Lunatimonas sp.]MCC5939277.1 hypothetical protein [Lunatimonas sp.]
MQWLNKHHLSKQVKKFETQSGLNFQTTAIFYDEKARVIQTLSQHQLGGTERISTVYNFEDQPERSLTSRTSPAVPDILRIYSYNVAGQLASISHKIGAQLPVTLVSYTYNDLGQQIAKTFPPFLLQTNPTPILVYLRIQLK